LSSTRINQWDERYREGEQVFDAPSPLVVRFTRDLVPGSALDLACGPGRNALYLAQHGWRVTAVDGSRIAIDLLLARASKLAREFRHPIESCVVDLETTELEFAGESFALALSCYYLQRSLLGRMKAVLQPGGMLIAIVHLADPDQPHGTPARAYRGELRTFFEEWNILHYREGEPGESCHRRAVAEIVCEKPQ
jgi:SAM-dependent methyltransferase